MVTSPFPINISKLQNCIASGKVFSLQVVHITSILKFLQTVALLHQTKSTKIYEKYKVCKVVNIVFST